MGFSLALQPDCCSLVGQMVHKFAELPFLDEQRQDRFLTERIAAYAFRFFVVLPVLTVASLGEAVGQSWSLAWVYLGRRNRMRPPGDDAHKKMEIQECLHTLATQLLFPIVTLGSVVVGKLPPANRISRENQNLMYRFCSNLTGALDRADTHLVQYLLEMFCYYKENNTDLLGSAFAQILGDCHWNQFFSLAHVSVYKTLLPFIERLSCNAHEYYLISALIHGNKCMSAILWPLVDEATREACKEISRLCEALVKEAGPKKAIFSIARAYENEDAFKLQPILWANWDKLENHLFFRKLTAVHGSEEIIPLENSAGYVLPHHKRAMMIYGLINLCHTIHNEIQLGEASFKKQAQEEIDKTQLLPSVLGNLVVEYLSDYVPQSTDNDEINLRDRWQDYAFFNMWKYSISGETVHKYTHLLGTKLLELSCAIEKKIFSLHLQGYRSAKFLGAFALGGYSMLEIAVIRPLTCCPVLLAVTADKIYQLFSSLFKTIFFSQNRANNFKKFLLTPPELIASIFIIALQPIIAIWRAFTMDIAQPVNRSINLYTRCRSTLSNS